MSQTALGVSFARHAVHIDKQDVAPRRRCACCPYPQSGPARFVTGCCLPLSWMCWKPSSGVVSAGGVIFGLAVLTILLGGLFYWGVEGQAECAALGIPFGQQTKCEGRFCFFLLTGVRLQVDLWQQPVLSIYRPDNHRVSGANNATMSSTI